jgi:glucose/arabinose dehydrogenase
LPHYDAGIAPDHFSEETCMWHRFEGIRQPRSLRTSVIAGFLFCAGTAGLLVGSVPTAAQAPQPEMAVPNLAVRTVVSGLVTPTTMAFLGPDDLLVLEKNTGTVSVSSAGPCTRPCSTWR